MSIFTESLSNFICELKNNTLQELSESKPAYNAIKKENDSYLVKLQSGTQSALLDEYVEVLYAIASLETNYCYLCGMRDAYEQHTVGPASDEFFQELSGYKNYTQQKAQMSKMHNELQAVLPPDSCSLLISYANTWNTITGLEKYYCYTGGRSSKIKLDEHFDPKNKLDWECLAETFL